MSVISLTFQLHCPLLDTDNFQQNNQACYQPLFAFLERNVQKYADFRAALIISGLWLEQAEKHDPDLIKRLQKLIASRKIELIASPYYHSVAFFYDPAEFEAEVWLYQERLRELFNTECSTFAHTDLLYNDQIGQWAATNGFRNILIGASTRALGQYSTNHPYLIPNANTNSKLLCRHTELSDRIMFNFATLRRTKTDDSVKYFNKFVDKSTLWGNLINLVLDSEIMRQHRLAKIIPFLDALVLAWLQNPHYQLIKLSEASQYDEAKNTLSIKNTTSHWDSLIKERPERQPGLIRSQDMAFQLPHWLIPPQQNHLQQQLYQLKPQIFRTEDEELINDFCTKTSIDYLYPNCNNYVVRSWTKESQNRQSSLSLDQEITRLTKLLAVQQSQQNIDTIKPKTTKNTNDITVNIIKKTPQTQPATTKPQQTLSEQADNANTDTAVTVKINKNPTKAPTPDEITPKLNDTKQHDAVADALDPADELPINQPQTRSSRQIRWKVVIE